jgi:hypothetical protein
VLTSLERVTYQSTEFRQFNESQKVKELTSQLDDIFGGQGEWTWRYLLDCAMTTICTNHAIPDYTATDATAVTATTTNTADPVTGTITTTNPPDTDSNIGSSAYTGKMSDNIFNQMINHTVQSYAFLLQYNGSRYAQLASGSFAYHLRERVQEILSLPSTNTVTTANTATTTTTNTDKTDDNHTRFVLYSAHDTSISTLLAAMLGEDWDGAWPAYASMLSIEIYRKSGASASASAISASATASVLSTQQQDNYLFRIVYNNQILRLPQCSYDTDNSELCELSVLLSALSYGQESMACSDTSLISDLAANSQTNYCSTASNSNPTTEIALSPTNASMMILLSALAGAVIGAAIVLFAEKRRWRQELWQVTGIGSSRHQYENIEVSSHIVSQA